MPDKLDDLSLELDKIYCGQTPVTADRETADLLEVALLLHKAEIPVQPPEHILSKSVQRAADGLTAAKAPRRSAWMYSGLLGAAAALLIFVGVHGLPSLQEAATIAAPPPQSAPQSQLGESHSGSVPVAPNPPLPEAKPAASGQSMKAVPGAPPPATAQPAAPPAITVAVPSAQAPDVSQEIRQAPSSRMAMKTTLPPPSAEQAALPAVTVMQLPGRTPDSVIRDPAKRVVRQIYDSGTARELIITQRPLPQAENGAVAQFRQPAAREADKGTAETYTSYNKVTLAINGQEVTLEGRQPVQALVELAQTLDPGKR